MKWIRRYKLVLIGGIFVLLAVLVSSGDEAPAPTYNLGKEVRPLAAVSANSAGKPVPQEVKKTWRRPERGVPEKSEDIGTQGGDGGDAPADSTEKDIPATDFDEDKARGEAVAEVRDFNKQLATELSTFNPNARKARLRAAELKQKALDLDEWIKSQDGKTDMTADERLEWQAQRQVWVDQAEDLRQVAQRLSATRGTKRKVRILAKEISDSLGD